jgi:hypothetical protein
MARRGTGTAERPSDAITRSVSRAALGHERSCAAAFARPVSASDASDSPPLPSDALNKSSLDAESTTPDALLDSSLDVESTTPGCVAFTALGETRFAAGAVRARCTTEGGPVHKRLCTRSAAPLAKTHAQV